MSELFVGQMRGDAVPQALPSVVDPEFGFALGTSVLTADGALPAEWLCPGDRIITRDAGMVVLRDTRQLSVSGEMVALRPGALTQGPETRLLVSPSQKILTYSPRRLLGRTPKTWQVPARDLVDGRGIQIVDRSVPATMIQLIFDMPHVIYAGGLELAVSGT